MIPLHTRHEIIRLHAQEELSEKQIADQLDVPSSTVHYWIQNYNAYHDVEARPKSGRPRVMDRITDEMIFATSDEEPFLPATDIRRNLNLPCSVQTVRNRLKERGLKCRVPAHKDHLRDVHRAKRHAYALSHINWPVSEWNKVVFSDEKIFCSSGFGALRVWRPLSSDRFDEKYISTTRRSGRFSIAVWACICSKLEHCYIHLIERRTLDKHYYVRKILNPIVQHRIYDRDQDIVFMHDRSPIHTSLKVRRWIENHQIPIMDDWPPKGPDMNPIENLWAEIERVLKDREVRDRHELWMHVSQVFEDLTGQDYVQKLIDSMPRRMTAVVQTNGGWTKY